MTDHPAFVIPEAEQAVIGGLLLDPSAATVAMVRERLPVAESFAVPEHRTLYRAILALVDRGAPLDDVAVRAELRAGNAEEQAGGIAYLSELVTLAPSGGLAYHADLVRDRAIRRAVHRQATMAATNAADLAVPVEMALTQAVDGLVATAAPVLSRGPALVGARMVELSARIEQRAKEPDGWDGLPTGLLDLDRMLGGIRPGQLALLAGRPSLGKTALALHIARHVAAECGQVVYFLSLEMGQDEIAERCVASEAGVNLHRRHLSDTDYARLARAFGVVQHLPILVDEGPVTPAAVRLAVQHHVAVSRKPVGLVVVDYLQLMRSGHKTGNRNEEVSEISRALKRDVAKGLGVPVLALSQLSRDGDKAGRRPRLSDLRDSGALEQDADLVLMLHQDEGVAATDVIVAKHRNGPVGTVQAKFDKATGRWENFSPRTDERGVAA